MKRLEELSRASAAAVQDGVGQEEIVLRLHQSGCTILESIQICMTVFDCSLGQAKQIVASQPCWAAVVKASKPLQKEFEEGLRES